MNAWPREKWHCDNSELLLVHLVELVLVKRLRQSFDIIRGVRLSIPTIVDRCEKLLMNQSVITKNDCVG